MWKLKLVDSAYERPSVRPFVMRSNAPSPFPISETFWKLPPNLRSTLPFGLRWTTSFILLALEQIQPAIPPDILLQPREPCPLFILAPAAALQFVGSVEESIVNEGPDPQQNV